MEGVAMVESMNSSAAPAVSAGRCTSGCSCPRRAGRFGGTAVCEDDARRVALDAVHRPAQPKLSSMPTPCARAQRRSTQGARRRRGTRSTHISKAATAKKFAVSMLIVFALTSASIGLTGTAGAVPSGGGSAQDTINWLTSNGYHVLLNRVGDAPLDRCAVTSIRPGDQIKMPCPNHSCNGTAPPPWLGQKPTGLVVYTTVYVTASC